MAIGLNGLINIGLARSFEKLYHWFIFSGTDIQDGIYSKYKMLLDFPVFLHWLYLVVKYYENISSEIVFYNDYNLKQHYSAEKETKVFAIYLSHSPVGNIFAT